MSGNRNPDAQADREPCRSRSHDPTIGPMAWDGIHTGRAQVPARCALYARARRRPLQPGSEAEIPSDDIGWKTSQSRSDSPHAKAHRTGQRTRPTRPRMDAKTSLIKTDTLKSGWQTGC